MKSKEDKIIIVCYSHSGELSVNSKNKIVSELKKNIPDYEILELDDYEDYSIYNHIKENTNKYKYKLIYIVLSEIPYHRVFIEISSICFDFKVMISTIIYHDKIRETLMFYDYTCFEDPYLNPGKIIYSTDNIIKYIKSIECPYYLDAKIIEENDFVEIYEKNNDLSFASEFVLINSLEELVYPLIISKYIDHTLIDEEKLEEMQKYFIVKYPKLKHLFKPSREKKIFIPYEILAKYYLYIYTLESNFFLDMNRELKNGNFDKYRIYIYLMYNALNKGIFKSYSKYNLYRGGTLSNEEFNILMELYDKKKSEEKLFFFSRKFLSFSKKKEVANLFLKKAINRKYTGIYVRFKIEGISSENFFFSNIDIDEMSEYKEEKEVLFLPLSCFEVAGIKEEIYHNTKIKVIHLRYLYQYKNEIDNFYQDLIINKEQSEENIQNFITKAINSKYSQEIEKCFDSLINQRFKFTLIKNSFTKKIIKYLVKILIKYGVENIAKFIGNKVSLAIISYFGFQSIPAFIITNLTMISLACIGNYVFKAIGPKKKSLEFKCTSLFRGYLPERCRKELFPELTWSISGYKQESFALELIVNDENEDPSWLIINIPSDKNELTYLNESGLTIIEYKGIPKNSFSAFFIFYVLEKEELTLDEFKSMKADFFESKKNPKYLLDSRILSIF